jgi:hypothetical protein
MVCHSGSFGGEEAGRRLGEASERSRFSQTRFFISAELLGRV